MGLNYDNKKIEVGADNLKSVDSKIRSSVGFTLYWSTPIGPLILIGQNHSSICLG